MRQSLRTMDAGSGVARTDLDQWLDQHSATQTIAVYSPLPGEVDLLPIIHRYPDRCWVYPKIRGLELTFHEVKNPDTDLLPGAFRILEPRDELPEVPITHVDAFLCPGLAFDPNGGRLGRGRGFYDRILAKARPDAVKIGICFKEQMVSDTFSEPHDVRMDKVICG